jgi:heterodisulfide reductase subunit C
MRKFALAITALCCTFGLVLAGEVVFVKFDKEKKELTVKEGDKEKTYKITDKTVFKRGDKDVPAEKALPAFEKMKEGKSKFELTAEKDNVTEIKMAGKKQ